MSMSIFFHPSSFYFFSNRFYYKIDLYCFILNFYMFSSYAASILLLICINASIYSKASKVICRDPDLGGQQTPEHINERKFILFGCEECNGAGFGNQMIFFPAVYYFAALTGRDLLIFDNSMVGEFCKIITCGFPMVKEMSVAFPEFLSPEKLSAMKSVKVFDFRKHMSGERSLDEYPLIRGDGYMPASEWWVYYNGR